MAVPTKKKLTEFLGESYQESDDYLIDMYLETHKIYREMVKEMKKEPLLMEHTNKAGATNVVKNPLLIEIPKFIATLNQLLKSLGLTPAQRKQLNEMIGLSGGEADVIREFKDF